MAALLTDANVPTLTEATAAGFILPRQRLAPDGWLLIAFVSEEVNLENMSEVFVKACKFGI